MIAGCSSTRYSCLESDLYDADHAGVMKVTAVTCFVHNLTVFCVEVGNVGTQSGLIRVQTKVLPIQNHYF